MPLKKNVKSVFLAALRSGDYPQGRGRLLDPQGGFCCLGVLCALGQGAWVRGIYKPAFGLSPQSDGKDGLSKSGPNGSSSSLPKAVRERAGLTIKEARDLEVMNDDGASFYEIANHIEEYM